MWYVWLLVPAMMFAAAGLTGAPYLPVRHGHIDEVFEALGLSAGQTMLELGCGDGVILLAAAKRGIACIGFEVNPIMFSIAWIRTIRYRRLVRVQLGNMWHTRWPSADGVYTFLLPRLMSKLDSSMVAYAQKGPVHLVSYAFPMPERAAVATSKNCFVYAYGTSSERP